MDGRLEPSGKVDKLEPFTILCSTCQSRIRVRDAKLIGQVANCPKCNSLVMITTPQPQVTVENPRTSVDSMAMTKDGIAPDLVPEESSPEGPLDDYQLAPLHEDAFQDEAFAVPPESVSSWEPEEPILPSDEWSSESSTKTKQYLLVGFLGISGVALALIAFLAFTNWYGSREEPQPELAKNSANPVTDGNSAPAEDISNTEDASNGTDEVELQAAAENGPVGAGQDEELADAVQPNRAEDPNDLASDSNSVEQPNSEQPVADSTLLPSGDNAADTFQADDPFDTEADRQLADAEKEQAKTALPNETLAGFAPILDINFSPSIPESGVPTGPAPITAADLGIGSATGRDPLPLVDWEQRRAAKVSGLIVTGQQSLPRVVNLWTHLSGMPTSVNFNSLAAANLDRTAKVKVDKLQDATFETLSNIVADAVGATWSVKNGFLELHGPAETIQRLVPQEYDLGDLTSEPEQLQAILQNLDRLFPNTKDGWRMEGTLLKYDGMLIDQVTWFRALRLLESLRVAAGNALRLTEYAAENLNVSFVQPERLPALEGRLELLTVQPSPIAQSIARVCAEINMEVWFDWPHLSEIGVGPATTGLILTKGRTPKQVLANFAKEYDLEFAILDEQTLWVSSKRGYRLQPQVFVLKANGRTPEQWGQDLESLVPLNKQGRGELLVFSSFDGEHVIVRCCWPRLQ